MSEGGLVILVILGIIVYLQVGYLIFGRLSDKAYDNSHLSWNVFFFPWSYLLDADLTLCQDFYRHYQIEQRLVLNTLFWPIRLAFNLVPLLFVVFPFCFLPWALRKIVLHLKSLWKSVRQRSGASKKPRLSTTQQLAETRVRIAALDVQLAAINRDLQAAREEQDALLAQHIDIQARNELARPLR